MTTPHHKLAEFVTYLQVRTPQLKLENKASSRMMRAVSLLLWFNKTFMSRYTTTIGSTVYMPEDKMRYSPWSAIRTMAHEYIHIRNAERSWYPWYAFKYLFPQILAALSLLSLVAIWHHNLWLLNLCWLLCLAPLPAPGRAAEEERAYAMTFALDWWRTGFISEQAIEAKAKHFYGSNYYFMRPGKERNIKKLSAIVEKLKLGEYDKDPDFKYVKKYFYPNE